MIYIKPLITALKRNEVEEELGLLQTQYDTPDPEPTTVTLTTTTGLDSGNSDGAIQYNFDEDPETYDQEDTLFIGDVEVPQGPAYYYGRGFVGFDISDIQGTVVSATLKIYQIAADGEEDPYDDLGEIIVDHVNFGTSLDASENDFGTANGNDAIDANVGTISSDSTLEWKTLDVTTQVQNDIDSGRITSQFRFRFTTNTDEDDKTERVIFGGAEDTGGTGNTPELVVVYQ